MEKAEKIGQPESDERARRPREWVADEFNLTLVSDVKYSGRAAPPKPKQREELGD